MNNWIMAGLIVAMLAGMGITIWVDGRKRPDTHGIATFCTTNAAGVVEEFVDYGEVE